MKSQARKSRESIVGEIITLKRGVKVVSPDGDVWEFSKEELSADLLKRIPKEGSKFKDMAISMSANGDVLYGFHPNSGSYIVKFKQFAAKKDELPAPRMMPGGERSNGKGGTWMAPDKLVCTAILTIEAGEYEGMEIPFTLDYVFERDRTGEAILNGSQKQNARWEELIEMTGADLNSLSIPYSSNVLPDIEPEFGDSLFQCRVEKGYGKDISELPVGLSLPKKKPAPAKPAAQPAAKPAKPSTPAKKAANEKKAAEIVDELYSGKPKAKVSRKPAAEPEVAAPAPAARSRKPKAASTDGIF